MKQFIVLIAVFLILMVVFLQVPLETVNYGKKNAVEFYVTNAKEKAKQEGCYTEEILTEMKENISKKVHIDPAEIIIGNKTTRESSVKYRTNIYDKREEIYIKVSVPFKKIIAANSFLGVSDKNNKGYFIIEEVTTSERIME